MPRARSDGWRGVEAPATPLQRNVFLDLCTVWLTSEPSEVSPIDQFVECTTTILPPVQSRRTGFAFTHSDELRAECAICGRANPTTSRLANPFTQCCRISMCNDCTNEK